jgi:hypothetical protein
MLRHPFFGIVVPKVGDSVHHHLQDATSGEVSTGRRTFFGRVAMLAAGAVAFLLGRPSGGQERPLDGTATWPGGVAGQGVPNRGGGYTTQALGEEGGANPPPSQPSYPPPGVVTTYAVGEEAGWYRPAPRPSYPPPGTVTTYAVGEEAGYGSPGYNPPRRYFYRPRYYYRY